MPKARMYSRIRQNAETSSTAVAAISKMCISDSSSLICMVVNFAVERRLSWSWIVFGAMVTSSRPLLVYMQA